MTDTRPVAHCPRCRCDVVLMPNGRCAWCETLVAAPPVLCACGCGEPVIDQKRPAKWLPGHWKRLYDGASGPLSRCERLPNGCLVFTGAVNRNGYGIFGADGQSWLAHRYAWTLAHGPIPPGLGVLHRCDNPPCFEVEHLFLGTQVDNMADCAAKGRARSGGARGEAIGGSKLTASDVMEIRRLRAGGMIYADIAERFGVRLTNVHMICARRTWKHVA